MAKADLIQEAQALGLSVDGGASVAEIQAQIDEAKAVSPVAPITSVKDTHEQHVTGAGMKCWNCKTKVGSDGVCPECGFDVKAVDYNGGLEAAKAVDREKARKLAEKG